MVIVIMKGKAWLTAKLTTMRYGGMKENLSISPKLVSRLFLNRFVACKQAPSESSRLIPLALDYTRLTRPKPKREPVRRLNRFVDEFDLPLDKNKVTQCASKIIKELRVWKQD